MYDSPLVGHYLIRNKKANLAMHLIDAMLKLAFVKKHFNIKKPKKILLCNIATIGDVALTTALLPVIRDALPDCKIGMVVGSRERPLIDDLVDHVHIYNHWKRGNKSSFRQVAKEIRSQNYDVSLDCCYYFPNTHLLTYWAKIPVRIGYTSGGFGPLLTHPVSYANRLQSVTEYMLTLLSLITPVDQTKLKPFLKVEKSPIEGPYTVIHMGSGNAIKEWPLENWRAVAKALEGPLVFTGHGEKESKAIKQVTHGLDHCTNLCDQLSLKELCSVIANAKLLAGVDTGMGHIAAATQTPSVLIYSGINPIEHFAPCSELTTILIDKPACYPCYKMSGCKTMDCVKNVTVEQVIRACHTKLHQRKGNDHQSQDHNAAFPYATHEI